jgi:hypothetical protein
MIVCISIAKRDPGNYVVYLDRQLFGDGYSSIAAAILDLEDLVPSFGKYVNIEYYDIRLHTMPVEKMCCRAHELAHELICLYAEVQANA